ncbi:MAG: proline--tRNA ligase [Planctomycetota bacterium]|nr:proline--tRNA ligase [Planctomycetota bacterium]
MLASRLCLATLREDPADAEVVSHRLLVRAGFIHKSGSGLYLYQPLMQRVLDKVRRIIAEEIARAGGLEITMPILQERELWERSGRWALYQASRTMLTVKDRNGVEYGLAPTAEEVVTAYAASVIKSYRQLPVCFFQQHTKFRDEIRPRFGLMRVKEFIMMDAYSFHASEDCLERTYQAMRVAYLRAFARLGLSAFAVEADTGAIGGSGSHEFMIAADSGEDAIIYCPESGYAANVERAVGRIAPAAPWQAPAEPRLVLTPGRSAIAELVAFLRAQGYADLGAEHVAKCFLAVALVERGGGAAPLTVAAFVRGDREVNEVKLSHAIARHGGGSVLQLRPMHPEEVRAATGAEPGYAGPLPGLGVDLVIVDQALPLDQPLVVGANRTDYHWVGFVWQRDGGRAAAQDDIVRIRDGDHSASGHRLHERRGIEVGHIFKLGTKYSAAMGACYLGPDQQLHPFIMGCYGIGSSRVVAAAVEQHHDADGIRWPMSIAPFQAVVVPARPGDEAVEAAARRIYDALLAAGLEAVLDDREAKPGVKFKDWDLIGVPLRVVCGRALAEGRVELKERGGSATEVPLDRIVAEVGDRVRAAQQALLRAADAVA